MKLTVTQLVDCEDGNEPFGLHKRLEIAWFSERLSVFQGLCSMELVLMNRVLYNLKTVVAQSWNVLLKFILYIAHHFHAQNDEFSKQYKILGVVPRS